MVSEESLILCFSNLGCDVSDKSVVDKCLQLCHTYDIDEETFMELWVAYTVPHSLDIDPTIDDLNKFEVEELKKKNENPLDHAYTISNIKTNIQVNQEIFDNVLDLYSTGESSTLQQTKRARSPEETENDNKLRAVDQTFTPSTYTTKLNTPNRAPSTTVRGKVLLYFGPDIKSWKKENEYDVSIVKTDNPHVPKDAVYMYEILSKQGAVLRSRCESFGARLCHIWNDMMGPSKSSIRYVRNVQSISQRAFRTWGRIFTKTDKSAGSKVVMLEGCKRPKGSNSSPLVRLDLSGIKHYSVFPGQVIAVEGINTSGDTLVAKELFVKGYALLSDAPKLSEDIRVYVAVGPFTPFDNLNYQPLWDLMERVAEDEPNVLILIGPFVEYTHPEIKKGTLKDTFQDFFEKIVAKILQQLQGKSTRVVLVPSNRDAHNDAIFPTPEFIMNTNKLGSNVANLYSMPDPCIINVEGLQIGITSVDILRHLGQQEVSNTSGMDRLGRLANHVLSQATFYPSYPPFPGLNLDTTLWKKYACFEQQPHIMILPSDIKHYCKVVNESLVFNPERLQKYIYAKLCIRPVSSGKWDPNNVSCEIAKV
ncbi:DNA polymerase alpha subunit B [Habropoda laboriosa]|uniref:DNA polymerase alpha subunit B n=1 Tax=Habropoda laboriosa TaxID=597456 RepID=A0A0L7R7E4_9HYME|nr:PREDICTED: DNA polymerase alpha subunit B [Habropoda laboriosa]KOC66681.1 DNA polymerase alpha subunit B [Habropoda laboriosa]